MPNEWRNDPQWSHAKPHTDRWDRALLAFGETVPDSTLTAAEAQAFADKGWTRWKRPRSRSRRSSRPPTQPNRAPMVAAALADVSGMEAGSTR